jgi:peroxiredoxin Q/BCP
MLKEGNKAIDFELENQDGHRIKLSDFKDKIVVLYFYPRDLSSGCTKEAQAFRDNYKKIKELNGVILGINGDKKELHKKFIEKERLPFDLLIDPNFIVSTLYNAYKERSMYGRKHMGIEHSTFIIDKEGIIKKVWRNVKVDGHIEEVITTIEEVNKIQ